MALDLQRQPSPTSCGPTTVAMIVGRPVAEILPWQQVARRTPARRRMRSHRTNVGELRRLLDSFGYQLGARCATPSHLAVVRVDRPVGRGWHWAAQEGATVYDPALDAPVALSAYHRALGLEAATLTGRLSWYPVAPIGQRLPTRAPRRRAR